MQAVAVDEQFTRQLLQTRPIGGLFARANRRWYILKTGLLKRRADAEHARLRLHKWKVIQGTLQVQLGLGEDPATDGVTQILSHPGVHALRQISVQGPRVQALYLHLQIQVTQRLGGDTGFPTEVEFALRPFVLQLTFVDMQLPALVLLFPGQFRLGFLQRNARLGQPVHQGQTAVVDGHLGLATVLVELKLQLGSLGAGPPPGLRRAVGGRGLHLQVFDLSFDVVLQRGCVDVKPTHIELLHVTLRFGLFQDGAPLGVQRQAFGHAREHAQIHAVHLQLALLGQLFTLVLPGQAGLCAGPGVAVLQRQFEVLQSHFMAQAGQPGLKMHAA